MKEAPILYFFAGNISEIPSEYAGRVKTKGNGKLKLKNVEKTGTFSSPFSDVSVFPSETSHTWRRLHEKLYIGVSKDFDPASLLRPQVHAGFMQELAGNNWQIPVLNPLSGNCSLPTYDALVWTPENGRSVVQEIVEEYADLTAELSDIILDMQMAILNGSGSGKLNLDDDKLRSLIAQAITINYDVTEDELLVLGVFRSDTFEKILCSIVDWSAVQEAIKDKFHAQQENGFFLTEKKNTQTICTGEEEL